MGNLWWALGALVFIVSPLVVLGVLAAVRNKATQDGGDP